jgi:hypothetical protein
VEAGAGEAAPGPSLTQEFFARSAGEPPQPTDPNIDPFPIPARPAPTAAPAPRAVPAPAGPGGLGGGAFEAAPVPTRAPRPGSTGTAPAFPSAPAFPAAPPPAPQQPAPAPPQPPAAAPADGEETTHWREVFQSFLDTRAECGEPSEGLTWEKFRLKLEANKSALVSKYACRTVRFQVYVKDGKAALKATPVR